MSWWRRMRHRERVENELDAELRDHVERQVAHHVRAGLSEQEARRRARLEFGGLDHVKEMCRDARGTRWIDETWQDLRFAARLLLKERWFTAAAVVALGARHRAHEHGVHGVQRHARPRSARRRPGSRHGTGDARP